MGRPVAMRPNYRTDGGYLLRLEAAIAKDERQSEAWRSETAAVARDLAIRLLSADGEDKRRRGKRGASQEPET